MCKLAIIHITRATIATNHSSPKDTKRPESSSFVDPKRASDRAKVMKLRQEKSGRFGQIRADIQHSLVDWLGLGNEGLPGWGDCELRTVHRS